jgi:hypothetical protein
MKIVDDLGVERFMGNNDAPLKCAYREFGSVPTERVIPRDEWPDLLQAYLDGPDDPHLPPVADQDGIGECNASATCTALESCRMLAGLPYVQLSAADLYRRINGGRDQGSMLEDGIQEAMQNGIATTAEVPYLDWRHQHSNAAAVRPKYKVLEAVLCPSFDHCFSAVLHGFKLITGILWYSNYTPDADGWLPRGRGQSGGHAIFGYKPTGRNGVFGIWHQNSWTPSWGVQGRMVIPETAYDRAIGGWWAIRSVVNEDGTFPEPVEA